MEQIKISKREEEVLRAIIPLQPMAYGVPIRQTLEETLAEFVSYGSVYAALEKLEGRGLVETEMGESRPERGGRRVRYYKVTGAGEVALRQAEDQRRRLGALKPAFGR